MSEGCEKLCQMAGAAVPSASRRRKFPDSDMAADSTPWFEVFEAQTMVFWSESTRFPVASSSKTASFETGVFLYFRFLDFFCENNVEIFRF